MLYERNVELSAPANVHIELTSGCNLKCRHCYNYWRPSGEPVNRLNRENLDRIIDELAEARVMHVILTGGEPLTNFDQLLYSSRRLTDLGISISMNSNLALADEDKMKQLKAAGLDHILSSLICHDETTHDLIAGGSGRWRRMVNGLEAALAAGIRITNNMVISQINKAHIYETGKFAHSLGITGLCGTRVSPPPYADIEMRKELQIPKNDAQHILDELLRVKEDFGLAVNALLPFPLCFLSDFEKYVDFAGRRCAGGTYTLSINATGMAHACQKEGLGVGNILDEGLKSVWAKTRPWRTEELIPDECLPCQALPECGGGCRTVGLGYEGRLNGRDNLMVGPLDRPDVTVTADMWHQVDTGHMKFMSGLRFRRENGFTLLNISGAKNLMIDDELALLIKETVLEDKTFSLDDFGREHRRSIGHLMKRGAIKSVNE